MTVSMYADLFSMAGVRQTVFICGCAHTGTSILSRVIGSGKGIYAPNYETLLFSPQRYLALDANLRKMSEKCKEANATVFLEKTPSHIFYVDYMRRILPGSKFILTTRDPRDVIASLYKRMGNIENSIAKWRIETIATLMQLGMEDCMLVKYEDFVSDTIGVTSHICNFIGIDFDMEMLNYHNKQENWFGAHDIRKGSGKNGDEHIALRNWQINQPIFDGRGRWRAELTGDIGLKVNSFFEKEGWRIMKMFGYTELKC